MESKDTAAEKRIAVDYLNFGAKTARRVSWEAWEFTVVGPHQIRVTNASYGYLKDDHSYTVGVEVRDGAAVPAECECPADKHREDYDCKHKVALATVGGSTVLNAAVEYESPTKGEPNESETVADKIRADGGLRVETEEKDDNCECTTGFPCADCFIDGKREFAE